MGNLDGYDLNRELLSPNGQKPLTIVDVVGTFFQMMMLTFGSWRVDLLSSYSWKYLDP